MGPNLPKSNVIENQLQECEVDKKKPPFFLDTLYCSEEANVCCSNGDGEEQEEMCCGYGDGVKSRPPVLVDHDLLWDEDELLTLFAKEEKNHIPTDPYAAECRREAVEWALSAVAHFSFSAQTAVLAVNYLDRFFAGVCLRRDKPWATQLAAVACLSLAAKVEETHVPLLLDLQVEESALMFEAKSIQRMEIVVLSTLEWRMNPVTPLSFLDYIARRLGLKGRLCLEFLRRSQLVVLSLIADTRFVCYLPSVIATATMLHVINCVEPCLQQEYQTQLLGILRIDRKEEVEECLELISLTKKRKYGFIPGSPNGVMDVSFSSNESWSGPSSVSSSPESSMSKKTKTTIYP